MNNHGSEKATNAEKVILLTGINGYIASHIAFRLLEQGYMVRGTSRNPQTLQSILSQPAFKAYANLNPPRLQHAHVPDMTAPTAFDEALQGVHAIIHTASPINFKVKTVDEFVVPAVGGVTGILKSAYKYNENPGSPTKIVSFVLTSSIAAIVDKWKHPPPSQGGSEVYHYSEKDWNVTGESVARKSEEDAKTGKGPFLPMVAYGASKAAAEKAMWTLDGSKPSSHVACTAVCPGVVTGPPVLWPSSPTKLNETLESVYAIWSGQAKEMPPQIGGASYIDVRDVADIHIWAMQNPEKSVGQRYLATNGKAPPQACADLMREWYPERKDQFVLGHPGQGYIKGYGFPDDEPSVRATRIYEAMGIQKFRGYDASIRDTVEAFAKQWPLNA